MTSPLQQLQLAQQNLQQIQERRQQLQHEAVELNSALTELQTTPQAYKIVGKLMIAVEKQNLIPEITTQKEKVETRLKNFVAQEEKLQQTIKGLQEQAVKELKK